MHKSLKLNLTIPLLYINHKNQYSFPFFFFFISFIKKCVAQSCTNILLDLNITKCGQLVILNEKTLHRLGNGVPNGCASGAVAATVNDPKSQLSFPSINSLKLEDLQSMNIAKNHPLLW